MVLVEVIDWPVRYNGVRYNRGEQFQIEEHDFMPSSMKLVGEVSNDQSDFFIGEPVVLSKKELLTMSIDGLKDYAKEFKIELGRASTVEGIVEKIVKAQK